MEDLDDGLPEPLGVACLLEKLRADRLRKRVRYRAVRNAALRLHRGGVSFDRSSDVVHVDVGRVCRW